MVARERRPQRPAGGDAGEAQVRYAAPSGDARKIKNGKVLGAIDRGIRIQTRRAKLLGLDAPTTVKLSSFEQHRFGEVIAAAEAGNEPALEALGRIAAGENVAAVCEDWKQKNRLSLASAARDGEDDTP